MALKKSEDREEEAQVSPEAANEISGKGRGIGCVGQREHGGKADKRVKCISAEREDVQGEEEQEADDDEVEKEKVWSEDEC